MRALASKGSVPGSYRVTYRWLDGEKMSEEEREYYNVSDSLADRRDVEGGAYPTRGVLLWQGEMVPTIVGWERDVKP